MSIEAISVVKPRQTGHASRKAVLLVLADYCDEVWSCYPSQERLANETELGVRTVRRILAELENEGIITRTMRRDDHGHRSSDRISLVRSAIESLPARLTAWQESQAAIHDSQPAIRAALPATDDSSYRPQEPGNRHMNSQCEPSDEPFTLGVVVYEPPPPDFQSDFWEHYPRRNGIRVGRASALKQWVKLRPDQQWAACDSLTNYSTACGQYPKDAERFLRDHVWEDVVDYVPPVASDRMARQMAHFQDFLAAPEVS